MKSRQRILSPLVILFILFNVFFLTTKVWWVKWGIDMQILLAANCLFFMISILTFFIQRKALENLNPNVFIRSVMASMMIKMMVCIVAVMVYALFVGKAINKGAVLAAMFLYLVYLAVEVKIVLKLNKQKNA